jgi:1-acyl-sn-glycerol-3-phosphate acyltransferase
MTGNDTGNGTDFAARLLRVIADTVTEIHPGSHREAAPALDDSLDRDLAFDSLGRVELFARIERAFDVNLPERLLVEAETPRDLLRALSGATASAEPDTMSRTEDIAPAAAGSVPHGAGTLIQVLEHHAAADPDRPHIRLYDDVTDGEIITYGALLHGARKVAAGLLAHDLEPGGCVAIMLPTGPEYFFAFFGILLAGGVPVPTYPPARLTQIEEHLRRHVGIVGNCRAAILLTEPDIKRVALLLRSQVPTLQHVLTVEDLPPTPESFTAPRPNSTDTAFLQYTSGSTGNPKGVVLTHANLLANIRAMGAAIQVEPEDVFVSWLPLYHDMGLIGAWLGSLYYAVPLVIMSPLAFLARPLRWFRAIHRFRGTLSAAPNFAYELCLRRIEDGDLKDIDLSSWRMACNGAEPVSPETVRRFAERFAAAGFPAETMMPMYGLAENCVGLAFPPFGRTAPIDRIERKTFMDTGRALPADETDPTALDIVACGRPLPGHQMRVVDAAGRELPERMQGRLQFLGPSATSGYFRNAEASRDLFDGAWLETGDLAYFAGGDVHLAGRSKEMIIRAGRNIHPAELEEAIGNLEGIRRSHVAVFGSPDPASGTERLVVLAESRRRDAASQERLRKEINALSLNLLDSPPDDVVLAPPNTVLKTSSGKIRRAASRAVYESGLIGKRPAVWAQMARLALSSLMPRARRAAALVGVRIFGIYAWAALLPLALITWLLVAILPPPSWRWAVARAGVGFLSAMLGLNVRTHGLENIPPPGRGCVFVCNHASYIDGSIIVKALPGQFSFVAKGELSDMFVPRVFLGRLGAEFVERFDKEGKLADAHRLADLARAGRRLFFFAEGTLQRMPGLLPFQMGAFAAAVEAGLPVVPVTIRGTRTVLRDKTALPRPGAIDVFIDAPIEPESADSAWSTAVKLRDAVRRRILHRSGEPDLGHERIVIEEPSA